jgi:chromosome segregation ATPase
MFSTLGYAPMSDLEEARHRLTTVQHARAEVESEVDDLRQEVETLQQELQQERTDRTAELNRLREDKDQLLTMCKTLTDENKRMIATVEANAALKRDMDALRQEMTAVQAKCQKRVDAIQQKFRDRCEQNRVGYASKEEDLRVTHEEAMVEKDRLVTQAKVEVKTLQTENELLYKQVAALRCCKTLMGGPSKKRKTVGIDMILSNGLSTVTDDTTAPSTGDDA